MSAVQVFLIGMTVYAGLMALTGVVCFFIEWRKEKSASGAKENQL